MRRQTTTRRRLLAGGGAVALAALSGCSGLLGEDGDGGTADDPGAVPADAEFLVGVDVQQVLNDDLLEERLREWEQMEGIIGEVPTLDELLTRIESNLGLDPRAVSSALLYATSSGERSGGMVAQADWSESEVETAMEGEAAVETSSYQGQTVFDASDFSVGVLPDEGYAAGQPAAVRDSIDAATGNAPSVDNAASDAYEDAPDGYARFGFAPSEGAMAPAGGPPGASELQHASGALYDRGDTRGGELHLEFGSTDAAEQTTLALEQGLEQFRSEAEAGAGMPEEMSEAMGQLLDSTSVSRDGTTVSVETTDTEGWLLLMVPVVLASFVLDLGEQQRPTPTAGFDFDWNDDEGTVTITHRAGDPIPPDQLFVYGGLRAGSWSDLGGETSASADVSAVVSAGNSLTIDAEPGARIEVVWESPDGSSATLATFEVPD